MRIESRRNVRMESNRKVPQTNRLSLGVLDMDHLSNMKPMKTVKIASEQILSTLRQW